MARLYTYLMLLALLLGLSTALLSTTSFARTPAELAKSADLEATTRALSGDSERTYRATPHPELPVLAASHAEPTSLTVPGPVTLSLPAPGATGVLTGYNGNQIPDVLTFSWEGLSEAEDYHLQVALTPDFNAADLFYDEWLPDTTFRNDDFRLWSGTTYYWRVRARNSSGTGPWPSQVRQFTTDNTAPGTLNEPADGAVVQMPNTLNWSGGWSTLMVDDDKTFTSPEIIASDPFSIPSPYQITVPPLEAGRTYYWRLSGGPMDYTYYTKTRSFTVFAPAPTEAPTVQNAPGMDEQQPIDLSWSVVAGPVSYTVEYVSTGTTDTTTVSGLSDTSHTLNGLEEGTSYTWRVRAETSGGAGLWSAPSTFSTHLPAPVDAPMLAYPLQGAQKVPLQAAFSWAATPRAQRYRVLVGNTDFNTIHVDTIVEETEVVPLTPLPEGELLFWKVRAINDTGEGPWSNAPGFFTEIPVPEPVLVEPVDGAVDQGPPLDLNWSDINGSVDYYEVQVNEDPAFIAPLFYTATEDTDLAINDGLDYLQVYYWRVRARRGPDSSAWAGPWSFETGPDPDLPLIAPLDYDNDVDPASVTLEWGQEFPFGGPFEVKVSRDQYYDAEHHSEPEAELSGYIESHTLTDLDPGTTYYWQVDPDVSIYQTGNYHFTTAGGILDRLHIFSGSRYRGGIWYCAAAWYAMDGALSYNVEFSTETEIITKTVPYTPQTPPREFYTTSCEQATNPLEVVSWRAQACTQIDGTDCGPWSRYIELTGGAGGGGGGGPISFGTEPPVLDFPDDGTEGLHFPLTLLWYGSFHTDAFLVEVYEEYPTASSEAVISETVSEAHLDIASAPGSGTSYYWRVKACSGSTCGEWSEVFHFTADNNGLRSPLLNSPVNNATNRPIPVSLYWQHRGDPVDYYQVQVAADAAFNDRVLDSGTDLLMAQVSNLEPDTEYFWRVKGWTHADIQSPWSEERQFRTDIIPAVPAQSMPTDGAEAVSMMNALTFSWDPSPGAATYGLRVMDASGTYVVEELVLETTTHAVTPEGLLVAGASYAWQVQACTGAGCSPWSQPAWTFTMEAEGPPGSTETKRYYYLTDHLGSVRATVDETGTVVSYSDYYPFGLEMDGRTHAENAKPTRDNYSGKELDRESEMLYYGARYYDPVGVRWLSVDPLAEKHPDWSPYNFVLANPLLFIDPDGRQVEAIRNLPQNQAYRFGESLLNKMDNFFNEAGAVIGRGAGIGVDVADQASGASDAYDGFGKVEGGLRTLSGEIQASDVDGTAILEAYDQIYEGFGDQLGFVENVSLPGALAGNPASSVVNKAAGVMSIPVDVSRVVINLTQTIRGELPPQIMLVRGGATYINIQQPFRLNSGLTKEFESYIIGLMTSEVEGVLEEEEKEEN